MAQIIINNGEKVLAADTSKNLLENLAENDIVPPVCLWRSGNVWYVQGTD